MFVLLSYIGYDGMKLHVQIGVPAGYLDTVDIVEVAKVFPYGDVKVKAPRATANRSRPSGGHR